MSFCYHYDSKVNEDNEMLAKLIHRKKAEIIIPGENWNKICEEMYALLPKEQAAKALKIVIKYTKNQ